jgi:DNA-binding response OmpR family regulator
MEEGYRSKLSNFDRSMPLHNSHPSVLIVDDEADICFLLGNILKQLNCRVDQSHTLKEGLLKLSATLPDFLFLDISLPDGSGLGEVPSIRRQYPGLKMIVMSAHDGLEERQAALANGADVFMSKPLSQGSVETIMDELSDKT